MKNLLDEFPSVSKAEWMKKIKKDLKGKGIADFDWQLAPGLSVSAFPHRGDFATLPHPISEGENQWQIGEEIEVQGDVVEANKMALLALEGGAEALKFVLSDDGIEFEKLLAGIDLSIVSTHLVVRNSEGLLRNFVEFAAANGFDTQQLRGSVNLTGSPESVSQLLFYSAQNLPNFKLLPFNASDFFEGDDQVVKELAKTIGAVKILKDTLTEQGISKELVAANIQFTVAIGKNYFLQIAKLRALRKYWLRLQQSWGIENPSPACIHAEFPLSQQSPDANTNLIHATTKAMSAVIGGVDVLTVQPSDVAKNGDQPSDFSRRLARNVQHILRLESHFDWVADPAAGSYFIENLTEKLLEGMRDKVGGMQ
ncbi:MAG: hypothetical protein K9J37_12015 [Saprospiraceae bacterium]|nr:hypothetical protein [Saprospiraceae bacterium]MCF8250634.1 hypothetical protein [Saprospiraceae bacterium]MCF8282409.1 hypothetical protein [Bacteroidales bacterium]MCF8312265.1 hypothetical protein [Saprospiraceae bacterium]MCF8442822.1 hypothetical protein [Saprospiraceae bacterium]